jgi:hypothetical protein
MKKTYAETRFFQWVESDTSVTIRSSGASYWGGSEVLVVDTYQNVTGPLMANSHPGSYCGQDAYSDMLITGGIDDNIHGHSSHDDRCGGGGIQLDQQRL